MTKGRWPSAPEDAVSMQLANVYIDASGSMGPTGCFERAIEWLTGVWGAPHPGDPQWRNTYVFNSSGVRPFDPKNGDEGCGGDGLASALEHARRQRRRPVVISDGGHGIVGSAKNWAWVNISDNPQTPATPPSVRYDVIAPTRERARGTLLDDPAPAIAARMAGASLKAQIGDETIQGHLDKMREERELLAETVVAAYHSDPTKADAEKRPPGVKLARAIVAEKREREERNKRRRKAEQAIRNIATHEVELMVAALSSLEGDADPMGVARLASFRRDTKIVLDYIEAEMFG